MSLTDSKGDKRDELPRNGLHCQWSFRKTGTMRTLVSQADIGVWVQAPGTFLRGSEGITSGKSFSLYVQNHAKSCNIVNFDQKMVRNAVHNAFKQWQRRSGSFSIMGTALPHVPLEMTPA